MSSGQHRRTVSASIFMCSSFAAFAGAYKEPEQEANINLAVASNFFGVPPSNSAITDLINAFETLHPRFTVTVVDNGATATLESNIINGNVAGVDLFLAADTATPQDLLVNHFELVAPYNSSRRPPLFTFNYAGGLLALLSTTPGVDLSCATGTCGYTTKYSSVAIADPDLAPYGVAAQSVLIGTYGSQTASIQQQPCSRISQYHRRLQRGYRKNRSGWICGNVGDLPRRQIPNVRHECAGLFPGPGQSHEPFPPDNRLQPPHPGRYCDKTASFRGSGCRLKSFVEFLTDFTSPPTPDSPMIITLKKFCYSAP